VTAGEAANKKLPPKETVEFKGIAYGSFHASGISEADTAATVTATLCPGHL
jgi:hypothetical protein